MKLLGNIIWLIFGGIFWAIVDILFGAIFCITIVGIPVGLQMFKFAKFVLLPFGKEVREVNVTGFKTVVNIIWAIFAGWEYALAYLLISVLFCITIIGIPFGKQYFKMASFVLLPLGRDFTY